MTEFLSLFTNIWGILLVLFFFGGSIFVHELGHYLAARWRGAKVERFSIGFGPRLFGWTDKNGVDWRVSLLPLGGYVALPQLADMRAIEGGTESDSEKLPKLSFSDRFYILVAGAFFNILFALFLAMIVWGLGRPSAEIEHTTTVGVVFEEMPTSVDEKTAEFVPGPAHSAGIQPGDRILQIDGSSVENWEGVASAIIFGSGRDDAGNPETEVTLERGGETLTVTAKPILFESNRGSGDWIRQIGIEPAERILVRQVYAGGPAERADLTTDDTIEAVDGQPLHHMAGLIAYLRDHPGKEVVLTVRRDEESLELRMTPEMAVSTKPQGRFTDQSDLEQPGEFIQLMPLYGTDDEGRLKAEQPNAPDAPSELVVFSVPESFPLAQTLRVRDVVRTVNGETYTSLADFIKKAQATPEGTAIALEIQKPNGELKSLKMPVTWVPSIQEPEPRPMVGFLAKRPTIRIYPNPAEQFQDNVNRIFNTLQSVLHPRSDVGVSLLAGPVGIGRRLHDFFANFDLDDLLMGLYFTVLLNVNLAILNLLPIPVLDGGHIVYALLDKLRGKPLPANWVVSTQVGFTFLLFGLMAYVMFFDVLRWQGDAYQSPQEQILKRETNQFAPVFVDQRNEPGA